MHPACLRLLPLSIACCGALLLGLPTQAATAGAKPTAKTASVRPAPKQATPRQQLRGAAKGLALAAETVEAINEGQLDVASRVLTGESDCEFNQQISVQPLAGVPGYFTVTLKGKRYRMLPRETATGAVRLEDPGAGVVWLQIPTKSMLMNTRLGQRMVDNCLHSEQRIAASAVVDASQGIGIVTQAVPAVAAAPVTVAPIAEAPVMAAPIAEVPAVAAPVAATPTVTAPAAVAPVTAAPVAAEPASQPASAAVEAPAAASAPVTR